MLQTDFLFFDMSFGYVVLRTILQNFLVRIVDLLCSCKDMGLQTLPFASVNTLLQLTKAKLKPQLKLSVAVSQKKEFFQAHGKAIE